MPESIPDHVAAWAKVHWANPNDAWYDDLNRRWITHGQVIPDADSDAWLAGMVRAMAKSNGIELWFRMEEWNVRWTHGMDCDRGFGDTPQAAIIKAVNGQTDDEFRADIMARVNARQPLPKAVLGEEHAP